MFTKDQAQSGINILNKTRNTNCQSVINNSRHSLHITNDIVDLLFLETNGCQEMFGLQSTKVKPLTSAHTLYEPHLVT
jgi:hypothetical protein